MVKKLKKPKVWIIEDDQDSIDQMLGYVQNHKDDKKIDFLFSRGIDEALKVRSFKADYIFLDMGGLSGYGGFGAVQWYKKALRFVKKHGTSNLVIYSLMGFWAKDFHDSLKQDLDQEDLALDIIDGGINDVFRYLYKYKVKTTIGERLSRCNNF